MPSAKEEKSDAAPPSIKEKNTTTKTTKKNKKKSMKEKVKLIIVFAILLIGFQYWAEIEAALSAYEKQIAPPMLSKTGLGDARDSWFVIVSTSRFWQNYRHTTNALGIYWAAKRSGVPDDRIVLMIAEKHACDARNPFPGTQYSDAKLSASLFCSDVEIDYVGDSVTAVNFLRVLTGNVPAGTPRHQQIFPSKNSNVVVYMTGHSGDNFMKFHDYEFISSYDMAQAFWRMYQKQRYHRLLFLVDTCQAATLYDQVDAPNVISLGSSIKNEDSYSSTIRYNDLLGGYNVDGFSAEIFWKFAEFEQDPEAERRHRHLALGNDTRTSAWRVWGTELTDDDGQRAGGGDEGVEAQLAAAAARDRRKHSKVVDLSVTTAPPPKDYSFVDLLHEPMLQRHVLKSYAHCSHYNASTWKMADGSNLNLDDFKAGWKLRDFFAPGR